MVYAHQTILNIFFGTHLLRKFITIHISFMYISYMYQLMTELINVDKFSIFKVFPFCHGVLNHPNLHPVKRARASGLGMWELGLQIAMWFYFRSMQVAGHNIAMSHVHT